MPSPAITIGSVEIPVSSLERAVHWYRQALGYSCTWSDRHHAMLANEDDKSATKILLVATDDPTRLGFPSTNTGVMHGVVDFQTDDLERAHAHLASLNPDLGPISQPANEWAPRGFGFCDSEGNRLAFFSFRARK
ncbi:MAG: VOC family protein [Sterolibacterium sp.]